LGKKLETWIADSYLGQGVRFLPGSRWGRRGGQGLEAVLKLNPSTLQRQKEQHQFSELHLICSLARERLIDALLPVWGISENAAYECVSVLKTCSKCE